MEIVVKIDLTPATLHALNLIFGTAKVITETPVKDITPSTNHVEPGIKEDKKSKVKNIESPKAAEAATFEAATKTSQNGNALQPGLTLDMLTDKVIAIRKAGKKPETVNLMEKYAITQLSKLPEDQYAAFAADLDAIKID